MKRAIVWLMVLATTACVVPEPVVRPATYDLGDQPAMAAGVASGLRPTLALDDVQVPPNLDSSYILYRLRFTNGQELRPYANSRWAMSPAQLFMQRMKNRLSGQMAVAAPVDASGAPILKIELDAFEQVFTRQDASHALVRLRASLIANRRLVAQHYFSVEHPATSADAIGGTRALAQATDAVLDDLASWLRAEMSGRP